MVCTQMFNQGSFAHGFSLIPSKRRKLDKAIKKKWGWRGGGGGARQQLIYFSMGCWSGQFLNYMDLWCLTKSNSVGDGSG